MRNALRNRGERAFGDVIIEFFVQKEWGKRLIHLQNLKHPALCSYLVPSFQKLH